VVDAHGATKGTHVNTHAIEQAIFDVAGALLWPVLVAALVSLVLVLVEAGRVTAEIFRRRQRSLSRLERATAGARHALAEGSRERAAGILMSICWSDAMRKAATRLVTVQGRAGAEERAAKVLADFDYGSLKHLERTRILVRLGPALGLMGTLIPLAPALTALANGDVNKLAENLRVAFSVTILGLLIGAIAFAISLIRDRLYSQDLSDLEYVGATLGEAVVITLEPEVSMQADGGRG